MSRRWFTSVVERTRSISGAFVERLEESRVLVLYTGGTLGMRRDSTGTLSCEKGYLTVSTVFFFDPCRLSLPVVCYDDS
jgi:L-asparaginase/Glu-tRNA(Gln) amidotransferase subunit D